MTLPALKNFRPPVSTHLIGRGMPGCAGRWVMLLPKRIGGTPMPLSRRKAARTGGELSVVSDLPLDKEHSKYFSETALVEGTIDGARRERFNKPVYRVLSIQRLRKK